MNPPPGIEALPNGQWVVAGDTHLGAWAKQKGTIVTDPNLFRFLERYLEEVKVVWSVGANIGDHVRQHLDWGKEVIAFEPNPITYQCLVHNCPGANCMNVAASDSAGVAQFAQLDNVGASRITRGGEIQVLTIALDDIVNLPVPGFIEIDIEGYEPFAITGMAGTITRHKPMLFVEMNRGALAANGVTPEGLHDMILSLGYGKFIPYPVGADFTWEQFDILYLK